MAAVQSVCSELAVAACAAQHPGDRSEQQDRVAILRSSRSSRCVLALVADGLGGRTGGAMAAAQVVMVAQRLVDSGHCGPERARLHPSAGLLTQALGGNRRPRATHGGTAEPAPGDRFLLCTDGLWAYFGEEEIGAALESHSARDAAEALIAGARGRAQGRGDNCSLVLLSLVSADPFGNRTAGRAEVVG